MEISRMQPAVAQMQRDAAFNSECGMWACGRMGGGKTILLYLAKLLSPKTKLYQFVFWQKRKIPSAKRTTQHAFVHWRVLCHTFHSREQWPRSSFAYAGRFAGGVWVLNAKWNSCVWHIGFRNVAHNGVTSMLGDHAELACWLWDYGILSGSKQVVIDCAGCGGAPKPKANGCLQCIHASACVCLLWPCVCVWVHMECGQTGALKTFHEYRHTCISHIFREPTGDYVFHVRSEAKLLCKQIIPASRTP